MSFLQDLIELITTSPGDMVYYLVTLFAIQLILGAAFGHWNRNRHDPAGIRLLVISAGFTLACTLLMLIALLARIGAVSPDVILPPLERFLGLVTLLLAAWAFVPILAQHLRLGVLMLIISLLIAAGMYLAFAVLWPRAEAQSTLYNGFWQEKAWEFVSIAVLAWALIASVIWREDDWSLATCLFAIWLIGHVLQFFTPLPVDSNTAGWVRLGNLAALPLIAGLAYRRVLRASPALAIRRDAGLEMVNVLGAVQRIEAADDIEAALKLAAPSIAHALGADMIAIGLPIPDGIDPLESGVAKKLRIVALHPATGTMLASQEPTLLISRHPLLATAIKTNSLRRTNAPTKDPTIADLYYRLGFEQSGPLLALPVVDEDTLLGIILAGNPVSQRNWTMRSEQVFQAMGGAMTTAWVNASRLKTIDHGVESQEALNEARRLTERAAELETELERQRQRAEELDTRLRLREQESDTESLATTEAGFWQTEMNKLTEAHAAVEAELAEWKERAEELAHSREELLEQLDQIQAELGAHAAVEAELAEWKERAEQLTHSREKLLEQLAQKQAELDFAQSQVRLDAELAEWREKTEQLLKAKDDLERQLAQAQAKLQEAQSQAVPSVLYGQLTQFGLGPRGILISDEQGNIILANQGARYLIGQLRSALEGAPLHSLFAEPSWAEAVNRLSGEGTEDSDAATVILRLNGQMIRAELARIPSTAGGTGTLAVMFYHAEAASAALQDETIVSLVHELRTPMTSITSYTDLLLGESVGILGETQRQFLQRINANIERMGGLLEDLAKVTATDVGQISLSPEPVDLINVTEDAIMSLSTQFSERDVGVQMNMPSELPAIRVDRDSLHQIVVRLLSNACECSKPGTEVLIHARVEEYHDQMDGLPNYLFMSVTDTGGGIAPEDQRRVFQRLYRADNPVIEGVGDTGVGLSIAKALVETQGGRIWVESEMGVSSTFSFILPLSPERDSDSSSEHPFPSPVPVVDEELEREQ